MTFHQLKIFAAVTKHLNITKAAREIRVSQPTVSKQLRLLEDEYGEKFYVRIGQGIRLTAEGRRFWDSARPILTQSEELKRTFIANNRNAGFLIVGGTQSTSAFLLAEALKTFKQTHPHIQPILRTRDSRAIEQIVLNSEVEVGLITNPSNNSQIVAEPLCPQEVLAVVSYKHPLAKKGKLSEEELAKVPLVVRIGGRITSQLKQMAYKLNIVMECESSEIIKAAVLSGTGVGLLHRDIAELDLKGGYLKAVEIPGLKQISVECFIIYRAGAPLSQDAQEFLALLRQMPRKSVAYPVPRIRNTFIKQAG